MKLPKGPLKVIFVDPAATEENEKRARAGGSRFLPPFWVSMGGDGENPTVLFRAFDVRGHMRLRSALQRFPQAKTFPRLHNLRVWMETTAELTLYTEPTDNYPQPPKAAHPQMTRVTDASTEESLNG